MTAATETAIVLRRAGDADELRTEPIAVGPPGLGEVRLRHHAIGVNFHDVYVRSGAYTKPLPLIPGIEAVGTIEAVGADVSGWTPGDRAGWVDIGYGGYATARTISVDLLIRLPPTLAPEIAASLLLKGLTAQMLVDGLYPVAAGDCCVVHAAAGGVGSMLVPWLRHRGACVIGVVGSAAKREVAVKHGCDDVVVHGQGDLAAAVAHGSSGRGAAVVYDSIGRESFDASLGVLRPGGLLASFGQSSGPPPPVSIDTLGAGSKAIWRPVVFDYLSGRTARDDRTRALFRAIDAGIFALPTPTAFPLAEAAQAHRALEARATTGPIVLLT